MKGLASLASCSKSALVSESWTEGAVRDAGANADAAPKAVVKSAAVIGFLEIWDECSNLQGVPHYTKGRKPGMYPSFQPFRDNIHFALDLYDPFGFTKKRTEKQNARSLIAEVNNGRLAMLGIFGFVTADKMPGAVPFLDSIGVPIPYDGNVMIPFEGNFHLG